MTAWWTAYWFWWLLAVFVSWLVAELTAIGLAHYRGVKNIQDWTLSDTIRRWSGKYRWLAPVAVGTMAMLAYHFFVQANLPS